MIGVHLPHAIVVGLQIFKSTTLDGGRIGYLSNNSSWSVDFSPQDETIDVPDLRHMGFATMRT